MSDETTAYQMPKADLGECIWFYDKTTEPMPATITQVGQSSVSVSIHAPDNRGHLVKDGVRHVGDPALFSMPQHDAGCWDFTAVQKYARVNEARLTKVEEQIVVLEKMTKDLVAVLK